MQEMQEKSCFSTVSVTPLYICLTIDMHTIKTSHLDQLRIVVHLILIVYSYRGRKSTIKTASV